ncbi:MAG: polysaccharide deacetylase family protein [Clostridia bacterium]|nr:polysaccharide deacetylase family protein [Clostridia bacterium]
MKKRKILCLIFAFVVVLAAGLTGVSVLGVRGIDFENSISAKNEIDGVYIDWAFNYKADGYEIHRWDNEEKEVLATLTKLRKTSFTDETAENGKEYRYSVCAINDEGESFETKSVTLKRIEAPEFLSVKNGVGGIELNWKKVEGVDKYTIYKEHDGATSLVAELNPENPCEYIDTTAVSGEKYKYSIVAVSDGYKSAVDYEKSSTYVPAPENMTAVNNNGSVFVSWGKVTGADSYLVYKKTNGSKWTYLGTYGSDITGYIDYSVVNGNVYTYTVKALSEDIYSGFDSFGVSVNYVDMPRVQTLSNVNNGVKITWNAIGKASQYRVYKKLDGETTWKFIGECRSTSFTDYNVGDGFQYRYTVRAVGDKGGLSPYEESAPVLALKKPDIKLYCGTKAITVKWNSMPLADSYRVYKKADKATGWTYLATVKADKNYYVDKQVKSGVNYTYTVRQVYSGLYGSYDTGVSTKFTAAPKLTAKLSPKGLKLEWNKANAGTGYTVERKTESNMTWKQIAEVNGLGKVTYTDSKAKYGEVNYYRIKVKGTNRISDTASIYGIDPKKPAVALTYDDGPHPTVTHDILDVLEKYDARATFFVVGSRVPEYPDCVKRASELGCEIGNHTYNHKILTSATDSQIAAEIAKTNSVVKNITGKLPTVARAPGGSYNNRVKGQVDMPLIQWSVDTLDWKNRNANSVISSVKRNTRDGSIILMHDLYSSTAEATKTIVPWLVKEGYQIVTVTELLQLKGIDIEDGSVYFSAS